MARSLGTWALLACMVTLMGHADAFYSKSSPVIQVDMKSYDNLISQSKYTSIVEFYAPWCGHCRNLQPAYEKAARNLAGLAKVAAVNCDEDANKPLCGRLGVQGFPTLKIVQPGSKPGMPLIEDYKGPRSAKGIVDAVVDRIPNHVKKVRDKDLEAWLSKGNDSAKAILFTEKGATSPLTRALAIDFLGTISVAQIRNVEEASVQMFGVSKFPSLILLPGGTQEPRSHSGEMKKEALVAFLSQAAPRNPDPPSKSPMASEAAASGSTVILEDLEATESPKPIVPAGEKPTALPKVIPSVETLATPEEVESACLGSRTGTCVLALLPAKASDPEAILTEPYAQALKTLAEISNKHVQRKAKLFPFYSLPAENKATKTLRHELDLTLETELEIIAVNGKKSWWMRFNSDDTSLASIESFIDAIKFGDGERKSLPAHLISSAAEKDDRHDEL